MFPIFINRGSVASSIVMDRGTSGPKLPTNRALLPGACIYFLLTEH
jgi:hypothetical protein